MILGSFDNTGSVGSCKRVHVCVRSVAFSTVGTKEFNGSFHPVDAH